MNRFHEGKACDAAIRIIEAREGGKRKGVRSPEEEGHPAPIELTCSVGGQSFALEHTGIEPLDGQIEIEAKAHFDPLRAMFPASISANVCYELRVPSGATLGLSKTQIATMISALDQWIKAVGPAINIAALGLMGTPIVREADALVPFQVKLYRHTFPNPPCGISIVHEVNNLSDLRIKRIRRAYLKKLPKLAKWKALGARTVLVLESVDDQLTDPIEVARAVLAIEKQTGNAPDEVYFVMSAFAPWFVWHIRVDGRSFFDISDPNERALEFDPQTLLPLTAR